MRLLFLGCSWTYGCELAEGSKSRFSTLIGKKLDADVVNLARNGMSNHAIARIFLEQDLESFDKIFVQLSHPARTEWYDPTGRFNKAKIIAKMKDRPHSSEKWRTKQLKNLVKFIGGEWDSILPNKKRFMTTGKILDGKEWWISYYEQIYTDHYGTTEEMLLFNLIKNKLTRMGKNHLIFSINPKCNLPIDLQLNNPKYPRAVANHPNEIGHLMIASDIMKLL